MSNVAVPAVEIDGVTKRYGRTLALDNVSFQVRPGELFALLGPNGAGKTTLLHILCTILKPDCGTARIGGIEQHQSGRRQNRRPNGGRDNINRREQRREALSRRECDAIYLVISATSRVLASAARTVLAFTSSASCTPSVVVGPLGPVATSAAGR